MAMFREHLFNPAEFGRAHRCLHEYCALETGNGLTQPGFLNWNTLAVRMEEST
jgi:hypothetical protein